MCRIMEEAMVEAEMRKTLQIAISLLKRGRDSIEKIADLIELPIEKVQNLAEQLKSASA